MAIFPGRGDASSWPTGTAATDLTPPPKMTDEALALFMPSTARAATLPLEKLPLDASEGRAQIMLVADQPVPVLHSDGHRPAPYRGGIGPDAPQVGRLMRGLGPEATLLWNSFITNYNDRSQESVIPKDLPLNEIDPRWQGKLNWFGPYADSDLSYITTKPGRGDLMPHADTSPGSSKRPGHIYAIGTAADTNGGLAPVAILDYESRPGQPVRYYGQYQFEYTPTSDGGLQVDISEWNPANANLFEAVTKDIAGRKHALNGLTEYKYDAGGHLVSAAHYLAEARNKQTPENSNPPPVNTNRPLLYLANGNASINDRPKLLFFDLFGQPPS